MDKAEKFKVIKQLDSFEETSAKTGDNVKETFLSIAKMLYKKNITKILSSKRDLSKKGKNKLNRTRKVQKG